MHYDLPDSIEVDGAEYKINSDFMTWAKIYSVLTDRDRADAEKAGAILMCYKDLPESLAGAVKAALRFYRRGKDEDEDNDKDGTQKRPVFDLEYDFPLLCAAFRGQYRIDLRRDSLHWWGFWELFEGLRQDELIVKVMGWRGAEIDKIKNKTEKRFILKMQRIYRLPDRRSVEEKDAAMADVFARLM